MSRGIQNQHYLLCHILSLIITKAGTNSSRLSLFFLFMIHNMHDAVPKFLIKLTLLALSITLYYYYHYRLPLYRDQCKNSEVIVPTNWDLFNSVFSFPYTVEHRIHTSCKHSQLSHSQPQPLNEITN